MAINSVSVLKLNSPSSINFAGSQKTPPRIPTGSDEFISQGAKEAKPAMGALRRLFYASTIALAGLGVTSCGGKDPITPDPPKPPVTTLTPLQQDFMSVAKGAMAVDGKETGMIDSLLVNDGYTGGNIGWKANLAKSTKDTLVFEVTGSSGPGAIDGYGESKFYKDANGVLTAKNTVSKNFKYKDPIQLNNSVSQYTKSGETVIEAVDGTNMFKFTPLELGKTLKQSYRDANAKGIVTKLFSSIK